MSKVTPFHSKNPNNKSSKQVYHNNNKCTEGNNIEIKYRKIGTAGRRLCEACKKL